MLMFMHRINIRYKGKEDQQYRITSMNLEHNHPPPSAASHSFVNRLKDLNDEHKDYIRSIAETGISAEDVLTCFRRRFPEGPPIIAKDVENMRSSATRGGSHDAHYLLQKLMALQKQDEGWFVRYSHPLPPTHNILRRWRA